MGQNSNENISNKEIFESFVYSILAEPSFLHPGAFHIFRSITEKGANQNNVSDVQNNGKAKAFSPFSIPTALYSLLKRILIKSISYLKKESTSTYEDLVSLRAQQIRGVDKLVSNGNDVYTTGSDIDSEVLLIDMSYAVLVPDSIQLFWKDSVSDAANLRSNKAPSKTEELSKTRLATEEYGIHLEKKIRWYWYYNDDENDLLSLSSKAIDILENKLCKQNTMTRDTISSGDESFNRSESLGVNEDEINYEPKDSDADSEVNWIWLSQVAEGSKNESPSENGNCFGIYVCRKEGLTFTEESNNFDPGHDNQTILVERKLPSNSSGLHQRIFSDIKFRLNIHEDTSTETNSILYLQFIPRSIYVDVDELTNWHKFGDFNLLCNGRCKIKSILSPAFIDIEKPTFFSKQHLVAFLLDYDYKTVKNQNMRTENRIDSCSNVGVYNINFTYPLHLRYPQPTNSSGIQYRKLYLPPPIILRNQGEWNSTCGEIRGRYDFIHNVNNLMLLSSKHMNSHTFHRDSFIKFEVPCGEKWLASTVLLSTITVGLIGAFLIQLSLYRLSATINSNRKINKRSFSP